MPRYGLPVLFGLALAGVLTCCAGFGVYRAFGGLDWSALLIFFVARAALEVGWAMTPPPLAAGWGLDESTRIDTTGTGLAGCDHTRSARSRICPEYAPRELRPRFVYLADPESAIRVTGTDTPDRSNLILAQFVPLKVMDRPVFQASVNRFFLFSAGGDLDWLDTLP
ncbi:MAG: hypothetical protein QM757_15965 [Paludibaculum sp.]